MILQNRSGSIWEFLVGVEVLPPEAWTKLLTSGDSQEGRICLLSIGSGLSQLQDPKGAGAPPEASATHPSAGCSSCSC